MSYEPHASDGEGMKPPSASNPARAYLAAALSAFLGTALARSAFGTQQLADAVMIYLLGIVLVSVRYGYAPSLLAAVLSVLCFDFFFVPPFYTLAIRDLSHVVTFGVMFLVALLLSGLTQRVRAQAAAASLREQRTAGLYAFSRELSSARQLQDIARISARHLHDVLGVEIAILVPSSESRQLGVVPSEGNGVTLDDQELRVAAWVWEHERVAGRGTRSLNFARASYLPLLASGHKVAVLAVFASHAERALSAESREHVAAFGTQIGSAIERCELAAAAEWARLRMETEQMRSSLLSSVSHDLRTPLAVMTGAASSLLEDSIDAVTRRELTESILEEAQRLNRLVRNLLDMTRLEAGAVRLKKEWQPLEEVVGSALNRLETALIGRSIVTELAIDLPLVPLDAVLIEQLLVNLLENAVKYTPAGSALEIRAQRTPGFIELSLADRGPGIPPGEAVRIFDKFYRVSGRHGSGGGVGLGLAIARAIAMAHGGRICVEERDGGGALFRVQLPIEGPPPLSEPPELTTEQT